jgi:short chain dehydrogenase
VNRQPTPTSPISGPTREIVGRRFRSMPEASVLRLNDTSPVSKMARDASPIACWMVYLSFASCCPRASISAPCNAIAANHVHSHAAAVAHRSMVRQQVLRCAGRDRCLTKMSSTQPTSITLQQSRVVVAGGTSGIGFAVAEAAARSGAEVIIASSRPERVAAALEQFPQGTRGESLDFTDEAQVRAFFRALVRSTVSSTPPGNHCSCKPLLSSASKPRSEPSRCATGCAQGRQICGCPYSPGRLHHPHERRGLVASAAGLDDPVKYPGRDRVTHPDIGCRARASACECRGTGRLAYRPVGQHE